MGIGLSDAARPVSGAFVDRTPDFAGGHFRTTTRLKFACIEVVFAGAIEPCCAIIHQRARAGQDLAGWANVDVALMIVGEVFAREVPSARADLSKTGMCGSIPCALTNHPIANLVEFPAVPKGAFVAA
jgi:hypothetical protein